MKKILLIIAGFLLLSSPAIAGSFPDVAEDHENFDAVEYLDSNGIINGYDDGTFGPDNLVNRAEAAKIIVGAFGIDHSASYEVLFPDVTKDQWFFPFVMSGREIGILNGYDDGKFKPENSVNLAETLKMVVLASDLELPSEVLEDVFLDVPMDVWYAPHALYSRNKNVVFSDDYGNLHAEQAMTRAAFAEVIYRMMIVLENNGEAFPLHTNWPTYGSNVVPFQMNYDNLEWEVIENDNEVIFFRPDNEFLQFSPGRVYLNSAVVWVTVDENDNEIARGQYFDNIRLAFPFAEYTEFGFKGFNALEVLYPNDRIVDWYIYLDNGDVLAVYTEYGNGVLGFQLQQIIGSMLNSLSYNDLGEIGGPDYSELIGEILLNVLVEGKGMEMLNMLPDKLIFETDTIGVGTGAVDYYYSEGVDYTFKYERSVDMILDTRKGQTSAF